MRTLSEIRRQVLKDYRADVATKAEYDKRVDDAVAIFAGRVISAASFPQTPKPPSKKKAGRKSKGAKRGRP
jgi:hypothetical protein